MALATSTTNTTRNTTTTATTGTVPFQKPMAGPVTFGLSGRLANIGSGGEQYEKLFEQISKQIKVLNEDARGNEKYAVVKLLKQQWGLNYSGIVVCETVSSMTSAHVLMVEKTGDYPDKLVETVSGIRYEILRTPADALDTKYINAAQQAAAEICKTDIGNVSVADGTLVPAEFDVTSEALIGDLINNTLNATHSEIEIRVNDYKGMNLGQFVQQNPTGKFVIDMFYNGDDTVVYDQTGLPIRQDVCIVLSYKTNSGNVRQTVNQGSDKIEVVKTYGYIDFEFTGSTIVNNMMMSTQKFVPNFIITHIAASCAPTPDILMLGVASVFSLNEDLNWLQAFRPSATKKGDIDYNDIGALNIEGNLDQKPTGFSTRYNTKSKDFTIVELNKLVTTLVRPNLVVSMDLPKAGPETWYTAVLQYIRFRSSAPAYNRLMEALSTQTNGIFVPNNVTVFSDVTNKIHGGFYKSKDGYRDLRHLSSYLSFANYITDTNQNPILLQQYTNTLYSSIQTELRAAERKKYIDEMSNKTAVVKQFYDRVTFNGEFMNNYVKSLKAAGFDPIFSNLGAQNDMFVRRSTVDFTSAMLGNNVRLMNSGNTFTGQFFNPMYNRNF